MCLALSTKLPNFNFEDIKDASADLHTQPDTFLNRIKIAYCLYHPLAIRKEWPNFNPNSIRPLSHILYIEHNKSQIYGIVQFFGIFQIFCSLGSSAVEVEGAAILGELDPVTGKERFISLRPQYLSEPPEEVFYSYAKICTNKWIEQLRDDVVKRGGKRYELNIQIEE